MSDLQLEAAIGNTILIVPSVNGAHLLKRLANSLDLPLGNVLVVDQASTDDTESLCTRLGMHCLQLGEASTFTRACNAGIEWARERGAKYICLCNNDVEFLTPVLHQLVAHLLDGRGIGAIAPIQIVRKSYREDYVYRCSWNLSEPVFNHDTGAPGDSPKYFEADFCEFTCVLLPEKVFEEVGYLDDDYGFYYEDADFCFRLQRKGYRCVYDQRAQIAHYQCSTFQDSELQQQYHQTNRRRFESKHLQYGVACDLSVARGCDSWTIVHGQMISYFSKYGLIRMDRPKMTLSHPNLADSSYLYTLWETTRLPKEWLAPLAQFEHIFVASEWGAQVFRDEGFQNVSVVPLGVETDTFHPWGPKFSFPYEKTFLTVSRNQYRKAFDQTIAAWDAARKEIPGGGLVMYGQNLWRTIEKIDSTPVQRWEGPFLITDIPERRITFMEPNELVGPQVLASLYRGADFFVLNSRSEGFGLPPVEAMACGGLSILPKYGACAEFIEDGVCLPFEGTACEANYFDKGFTDVGNWWEPSVTDITRRMVEADRLSTKEVLEMQHRAEQLVRSRFTWRNTCWAMYDALEKIQTPSPRFVYRSLDGQIVAGSKSGSFRSTIATGLLVPFAHRLISFATLLGNEGWKAAARHWLDCYQYDVKRKAQAFSRAMKSKIKRQLPSVVSEQLPSYRASEAYKRELFGALSPLVPPIGLMSDGPQDYQVFKENGEEYLDIFTRLAGLAPNAIMLDLGCGMGRKALPLIKYLDPSARYVGLDVRRDSVRWCREAISLRDPRFEFRHIDVWNGSYNSEGMLQARDFQLPFSDAEFDFVCLCSVFTHMLLEDVTRYMFEISRVLKPGGSCVVTFFLLNEESRRLIAEGQSTLPFASTENEDIWVVNPKRFEEAIGFDEKRIVSLCESVGVDISLHHGTWCGRRNGLSYQDVAVCRKRQPIHLTGEDIRLRRQGEKHQIA